MQPSLVDGFGIVKKLAMKNKWAFWITFILILIFSVWMNDAFLDSRHYLQKKQTTRDIIEISGVIITGLLGLIYFNSRNIAKQFVFIWKVIYIAGIVFFIAISLIDNFVYAISYRGQFRFGTLKAAMTSPLIFIILSCLNRFLPKINTSN